MSYEDVFGARGAAYAAAMRAFPDARRAEFETAVDWAAPESGSVVLDVPAGGGYLARYLPPDVRWLGHEPCASLDPHARGGNEELLPLPGTAHSVDRVISIAGVHHLADKQPLFDEFARVLKPGGRLVLADVHADSPVARFLDGFVDRHNSTGHAGLYLDRRTLSGLTVAGLSVTRAERVRYGWSFADRAGMAAFCRGLFDMRGVDDALVIEAIEHELGLVETPAGVALNWELFFIAASR